jgi:hypothetical protein
MINPSAVTIPAVLLTDRYAKLRPTITRVQDRVLFSPQRIPTELELQAVGSPENSGQPSHPLQAKKLKSSSLGRGIGKPDQIFAASPFDWTAPDRSGAASKST